MLGAHCCGFKMKSNRYRCARRKSSPGIAIRRRSRSIEVLLAVDDEDAPVAHGRKPRSFRAGGERGGFSARSSDSETTGMIRIMPGSAAVSCSQSSHSECRPCLPKRPAAPARSINSGTQFPAAMGHERIEPLQTGNGRSVPDRAGVRGAGGYGYARRKTCHDLFRLLRSS